MTAIFELHLPSETLAADELSEITGARTNDGQRAWLDANRWKYHTNREALAELIEKVDKAMVDFFDLS